MSSQGWVELVRWGSSDGPTLTAAAAASCIPTEAKHTFPAQYFRVGSALRITMHGRISTVITTPGTARFDVRMGSAGSTIVFDSLAMVLDTAAAYTTLPWKLVIELTCRAAGSGTSTTFMGLGTWTSQNLAGSGGTAKGALTALLPWNTAPAVGGGTDNTAANVLDVFFTQTVATGSLTVHQYLVESLN